MTTAMEAELRRLGVMIPKPPKPQHLPSWSPTPGDTDPPF